MRTRRPLLRGAARNRPGASARLRAPATQCEARGVQGSDLDRERIGEYVDRSLMLLTAPSPVSGHDKTSAIAHKANDEGTALPAAAPASGHVSAEEFDRIAGPAAVVGPTPRHA
ncbi:MULTISPECIES: hypothetical protein [Streptomyces]|uniref:Fumarase C C-terminal domain-containing protein n=1 Tax=Streptomyces flaveolus TaxID=67297 RepID=A0ABV3AJX6_9ACTN|nr:MULTISPECIES: hypothetical protein [Streptomyces]